MRVFQQYYTFHYPLIRTVSRAHCLSILTTARLSDKQFFFLEQSVRVHECGGCSETSFREPAAPYRAPGGRQTFGLLRTKEHPVPHGAITKLLIARCSVNLAGAAMFGRRKNGRADDPLRKGRFLFGRRRRCSRRRLTCRGEPIAGLHAGTVARPYEIGRRAAVPSRTKRR